MILLTHNTLLLQFTKHLPMAQKKQISKQKTSWAIGKQIEACNTKLKKLVLAIEEKKFYALKGKINNLEKQLVAAKQHEFEAM